MGAVSDDDPPSWHVDVDPQPDGVVVHVAGDLDLETAPLLIADAEPLFRPDHAVVIDLRRLAFIDSSGLAALIRLHRHASGNGSRFEIIAPGPPVAKAFQITGLDQVLPLRGDA